MNRRLHLSATLALLGLLMSMLTVAFYRSVLDLASPYPAADHLYLPRDASPSADTVYFGVISRYPSNVIYQGYQPLMDYLSAATGYQFALRLSDSYEETVHQLVDGRVMAAFLGSYLYVQASEEHGIVCILQPLNEEGEPWFRSALIASEASEIESVRDLAGRRLALPSELSFSANWLPLYELGDADLDVSDLASVRHFPHHHTVVYEVLRGNFDAGVVKGRVAREFQHRGVRIVASSYPIPGSPIVVPSDHDVALVAAVTNALLRVDPSDPEFAALVRTWDAEFAHGFGVARDSDYDVIRHMLTQRGR